MSFEVISTRMVQEYQRVATEIGIDGWLVARYLDTMKPVGKDCLKPNSEVQAQIEKAFLAKGLPMEHIGTASRLSTTH